MAREKHIIDLTIGNFKRFHNFEVKNLGQFNLIVGDNNTGKTSFLEALLLDGEKDIFTTIHILANSLSQRSPDTDNHSMDYLYQNFSVFLNKDIHYGELAISIKGRSNVEEHLALRKFNPVEDIDKLSPLEREKLLLLDGRMKGFSLEINNDIFTTLSPKSKANVYFPFIPFGEGYRNDLVEYYSNLIGVNKQTRDIFIKRLRVLIPKVNDVRIGNHIINIYEDNDDYPMPLYTYGEGANKLFRILCEIAIFKGKRLMIDEIDTGIHYSRFKSFWRTILQAAKAYDVQIFATTHNIECVDYFREVLEEEGMTDYQELARVVSLKAKEDAAVKATVYDYDAMQIAEETNFELRGGRL